MKQLSLIEKAFFIKKIRLFQDLDLDLLVAIADKMHQDIYDANEKVFEIDQRANRMYFIIKGKVVITSNTNTQLEELSETNYFGDESLFNEKPRLYNATCSTDALFMTLTRTNLMTIISECPSVAIMLLQNYSKNILYKRYG
jgi:CRP/FNR family transcriptional regulator, cyclic AMP receptor protein